MISWEMSVDVVVVGSGVAGLTAAHDCAAAGVATLVVSKDAADAGSTAWAQGGIAVVDDATGDTVAAHLYDTVVAGAGLTDPVAAQAVVTEGPDAVRRLRSRGAEFDAGPAGLLRTREGGHHFDRIIHAGGDATGAEVERALLAAPGLPGMLTRHQALDVVQDEAGAAGGITVLDPDGGIGLIRAARVVLATGGSGHLYSVTTNPAVATGDGLAMALRAGAVVSDIEFVQFHPTALFAGEATGQRPLVSEAVRGAGAFLVDGAGRRVMTGVHPLEDLAPRDVVALAITRRLAESPGGIDDHVFLDATGIENFAGRFPTITAACRAAGIDPVSTAIPVAPAAHYQCGGVSADLNGRTSIPHLYAIGEVARSGLHGANRLASNSLLEGLVMGERAAATIAEEIAPGAHPVSPTDLPEVRVADPGELDDLQRALSAHAGIGRTATGLANVRTPVVRSAPEDDVPVRAAVETANIALAARALLTAAAVRTESRGCHVRLDFPERRLAWAQPIELTLVDDELVVGDLRTPVAS
ncbi:L-aspartate oxidase [Nakamurella sp. DB0629]|uniref:L-aspartate oxidase n=1 Tax=Nakamurella aerolata TaxID=1656892 RepID=A0A849A3I5_9ACTN|nr:L-aspartate oxidase [Nakamurella aerolata]